MFDIGFWEISLIFVVGLLILGPERMPQVARTAGLFLGRARAAMRKLQHEVQRELMIEETRAAVDEARAALQEQVVPSIRPEPDTAPRESVARDVESEQRNDGEASR